MYCQVFFAVKCVKLLRSKVCVLSKVFFEAKCASAFWLFVFISEINLACFTLRWSPV